jgi:predicted metal-binding protein
MRYCDCSYCVSGRSIENPFEIYEKKFELTQIDLTFDYRAVAQCRFGCNKFNNKATCPPNIPEMEFFQRAFREYQYIYILGRRYPFNDGNFMSHWRSYSTNEVHNLLLKKEDDFFQEGWLYAKAFIGGSCKICSSDNCKSNICRIPSKGRAPLEATGVNIFKLMTSLGLDYENPPVNYFWRIGAVFF